MRRYQTSQLEQNVFLYGCDVLYMTEIDSFIEEREDEIGVDDEG